jgi:hypothetical protein
MMAENDKSFPKIAESNWWKLRNLFKQKVPALVTTTYLASALSMTEVSARGNIITPFKKLGILDEAGKPTDLAYDWRDDAKYGQVCQALLEKIYPQEIRDLYPSIESDQKAITSWFMNYCSCGEPAAKMYTTFYRLLLMADPTSSEDVATKKQKTPASLKQSKVQISKKQDKAESKEILPDTSEKETGSSLGKTQGKHGSLPQLHINIQLHISPETTAEQIDKIFESMARHLKDFRI